jgi:hypothetical protein
LVEVVVVRGDELPDLVDEQAEADAADQCGRGSYDGSDVPEQQ